MFNQYLHFETSLRHTLIIYCKYELNTSYNSWLDYAMYQLALNKSETRKFKELLYVLVDRWNIYIFMILFGTYFSTDAIHRTFSDAKPPTKRLAKSIVRFVASASSWHFRFSAIAFSNSAVSFASFSSKAYKKINLMVLPQKTIQTSSLNL